MARAHTQARTRVSALLRTAAVLCIALLAGQARGECLDGRVMFESVHRHSGLSVTDFYRMYAMQDRPVVITDYSDRVVAHNYWSTLAELAESCGDAKLTLAVYNKHIRSHSHAEYHRDTTLGAYARLEEPLLAGPEFRSRPLSALAEPLRTLCPKALDTFVVPKYFTSNVLGKLASEHGGSAARIAALWPALSFGPAGVAWPLRREIVGLASWIYVVSGTAVVRLVGPSDDCTMLHETSNGACGFDATFLETDAPRCPESLAGCTAFEATLSKGDVLFVPAGAAYSTRYVTEAIVLTTAYTDAAAIRHTMRGSADPGPHARASSEDQTAIYSLLNGVIEQDTAALAASSRQRDMFLAEYDAWPRARDAERDVAPRIYKTEL